MEVRDAAPGDGGPQIESDIESLRLKGGRQQALPDDDFLEKIGPLGRGKLIQLRDLAKGHGQQVSRVVGEAIEQEIRKRRAVDDQCAPVVVQSR